VRDFHPVARLLQPFGNIFRDHDGAVLTDSAAEGNGQVTLSFVNVVRQKINQQLGDALNELFGLRE